MSVKITHYRQRIALEDSNKRKIMEMIEWTEEQYMNFQYNCGLEYLHQYIPNDPQGIRLLEGERMFWSWWRTHWLNRDIAYIQSYALFPLKTRIKQYLRIHSPADLAKEIHPNGVILTNTYAKMIGHLHDSK